MEIPQCSIRRESARLRMLASMNLFCVLHSWGKTKHLVNEKENMGRCRAADTMMELDTFGLLSACIDFLFDTDYALIPPG